MASALIHMCVSKKVNEVLKIDEKPFLLGSIAPDIAKFVGRSRNESHFVTEEKSDVPNINVFLSKYKEYLNNPFELGYFVHLLTDVLWYKEFKPNFIKNNKLIDKDGNQLKFSEKELLDIVYSDYTNLNGDLIDYYNMDFSLFYESFDMPESHIDEVPSVLFGKILDIFGDYSKAEKKDITYVLETEKVVIFIEYAVKYCLDEYKKLKLVENNE